MVTTTAPRFLKSAPAAVTGTGWFCACLIQLTALSYLSRTHIGVAGQSVFDKRSDPVTMDKAAYLMERTKPARRLKSLQGNDVTDFWKAEGDLRAWVSEAFPQSKAPNLVLRLGAGV